VSVSAEQYVRRVIVSVARQTGRSAAVVAQESYAVTLWTYYESTLIDEELQTQRLGERTDLAGMMAVAFHSPKDLQKLEMRYMRQAGMLSGMIESTRARMARLMNAHANVRPVTQEGKNG
jgi:hypothetical protein